MVSAGVAVGLASGPFAPVAAGVLTSAGINTSLSGITSSSAEDLTTKNLAKDAAVGAVSGAVTMGCGMGLQQVGQGVLAKAAPLACKLESLKHGPKVIKAIEVGHGLTTHGLSGVASAKAAETTNRMMGKETEDSSLSGLFVESAVGGIVGDKVAGQLGGFARKHQGKMCKKTVQLIAKSSKVDEQFLRKSVQITAEACANGVTTAAAAGATVVAVEAVTKQELPSGGQVMRSAGRGLLNGAARGVTSGIKSARQQEEFHRRMLAEEEAIQQKVKEEISTLERSGETESEALKKEQTEKETTIGEKKRAMEDSAKKAEAAKRDLAKAAEENKRLEAEQADLKNREEAMRREHAKEVERIEQEKQHVQNELARKKEAHAHDTQHERSQLQRLKDDLEAKCNRARGKGLLRESLARAEKAVRVEFEKASQKLADFDKQRLRAWHDLVNDADTHLVELDKRRLQATKDLEKDVTRVAQPLEKVCQELSKTVEEKANLAAKIVRENEVTKQLQKDVSVLGKDLEGIDRKRLNLQKDVAQRTAKCWKDAERQVKQAASDISRDIKRAVEADELVKAADEAGKKIDRNVLQPTAKGLQEATRQVSEVGKPVSDFITEEVAPIAKTGIVELTKISTATAQWSLKIAGEVAKQVGEKEMQAKLNAAADRIARETAQAGKVVADVAGQVATCENAVRVAAQVAGNIVSPGAGGVAAASLVDVAQGKTVDATSVAAGLVSGAVGEAAGSAVSAKGGQVAAAAIAGSVEGTTNYAGNCLRDKEAFTPEGLAKAAAKGGVRGAVSQSINGSIDDNVPVKAGLIQGGGKAAENLAGQVAAGKSIDELKWEDVAYDGLEGLTRTTVQDGAKEVCKRVFSKGEVVADTQQEEDAEFAETDSAQAVPEEDGAEAVESATDNPKDNDQKRLAQNDITASKPEESKIPSKNCREAKGDEPNGADTLNEKPGKEDEGGSQDQRDKQSSDNRDGNHEEKEGCFGRECDGFKPVKVKGPFGPGVPCAPGISTSVELPLGTMDFDSCSPGASLPVGENGSIHVNANGKAGIKVGNLSIYRKPGATCMSIEGTVKENRQSVDIPVHEVCVDDTSWISAAAAAAALAAATAALSTAGTATPALATTAALLATQQTGADRNQHQAATERAGDSCSARVQNQQD